MIATLPPGTLLKNDSYRITRLLGQGGFGSVYQAEDLILHLRRAIKEGFDNSLEAQKQFEVEARILLALRHDNLPQVTDNFIEPTSGRQYLVMEFVEGQDLSDLVDQQGGLPAPQVLMWMDQVLDAVEYLHEFKPKIIHRDIKPGNIRLLPDGQTVKLVDFGIAKIGGQTQKTHGAARGVSPGFSPPEQYGTGTDTYSDVYALGATLYCLLTGKIPPESLDLAYSSARLIPPRQLNPGISVAVEQVILQAMQTDPQRRFKSATPLRRALTGRSRISPAAARPGLPVSPPSAAPAQPVPPTMRAGGQVSPPLPARPPVSPPRQQPVSPPAPQSAPVAICPHCGQPVRPGARFCQKCGGVIVPVGSFKFLRSGQTATTVKELVIACNGAWDEAVEHFWRGDLDAWLNGLGERDLANQARDLRGRHTDRSAALQAFLEIVDPANSDPIPAVSPTVLDFGPLRKGETRALAITIANSGRGYLHGTLQAQPTSWITLRTANFGCLAGKQVSLDVMVQTQGLSGTESGSAYSGTIVVQSNRGQQSIGIQLKVIEEPRCAVDPPEIQVGALQIGSQTRAPLGVSNAGGGTLRGNVRSLVAWLTVDPTTESFTLGKGDRSVVFLNVDARQLPKIGNHEGWLQVQSNGGSARVRVECQVIPPFLFDLSDPTTAVRTGRDILAVCDSQWVKAVAALRNGRLAACVQFFGLDEALPEVQRGQAMADLNAGLEVALRALGAKPATRFNSNAGKVTAELGYGLMPRFGKRPDTVTLTITNTNRRGYLFGTVEPLVSWLTVDNPGFGCQPGETAEIVLRADHQAAKSEPPREGLFRIVPG
jgi:serine/threonine protein kinase